MHTASPTLAFSPFDIPPVIQGEWALTLLGPSTRMSQLWTQVRRLAPYIRTALLTGEPDAGQEAVARLLLDLSPNPQRPFFALDATEAEDRLGRPGLLHSVPVESFLFLCEADRLSALAQENLLRLLRTRRPRSFSVIAATSRDLRTEVSMGHFGAELADVLGSVRIAIPSLKERVEDVPMLLSQALAVQCGNAGRQMPPLSDEFLKAALQHPWSGNLVELSTVVNRLVERLGEGTALSAETFASAVYKHSTQAPPPVAVRMIKLDTVIQEHIYAVLRACHGNKLRAAEVLGISRSTLYRMLDSVSGHSLPLAS